MGCRGQVLIKDTSIYLYTHWRAETLVNIVKKALAKRWRWDDPEYLARIIFDEMKGNDFTETSFGIGSSEHGDIEELVVVDCEKQTVNYKGSWGKGETSFEEFIKNGDAELYATDIN